MRTGFTIGRLFGIQIKIDWSWLLIFVLVTWNLSVVFGEIHTGWAIALRWSVALTAALLFFVSVLAHEMAHSLAAQAQGVPVRSIMLFLFGGVSNIQREPPSPRAEFFITIVGPVTSFVIGALITVAGVVLMPLPPTARLTVQEATALAAELSPLTTVLLWLGPINIFLGLFNLIPGFPLDGGRLLRSLLWAITDDLRRATRWASWVGQGIAWLMAGFYRLVLEHGGDSELPAGSGSRHIGRCSGVSPYAPRPAYRIGRIDRGCVGAQPFDGHR